MWLAVCFLAVGSLMGTRASAQPGLLQDDAFCADCCDHDLQFFSPVEFDFDCMPITKECGWFFGFDKLSWAFTGDRTAIGDQTLVVQSEQIFRDTVFSRGVAPPTYQIFNSIQDAPPEAAFGWGERYEFGKFNENGGWLIGVLDGPKATSDAIYGFQNIEIPNTVPLDSPSNNINFAEGFTAAGPDAGIFGSANLSTSRNGFGSVHVNFATPAGFLLGFVDYSVNGPTNSQNPTGGGPGRQVLTTTVVDDEITDITYSSGADGIPDDLNGDLFTFFLVFVDANGNGTFDDGEEVGNGVDFDDLHTFNVRFDSLSVRNTTETQGFEMMRMFNLSNSHKLTKDQNRSAVLGMGVRYFRLRDDFYWEGKGDLLGRTFAETSVQNSIVGPQIRGMWKSRHGRWDFDVDGRFVWGYNVQDLDQYGAIGEDLNPGAVNRPIAAQPNVVKHGRTDNDFSPLVEFRAESSYRITSSIKFKLGYTAIFVDNVTRASQAVRWYLPDLGLLQGGQQDIFINGANVGFDVMY